MAINNKFKAIKILKRWPFPSVVPNFAMKSFFFHKEANFTPDYSNLRVWKDGSDDPWNNFTLSVWDQLSEMLQVNSTYQVYQDYSSEEVEKKTILEGDVFLMRWRSTAYPGTKTLMPIVKTWYEVYIKKPIRIESSRFYVDILPSLAWACNLALLFLILLSIWVFHALRNNYKTKRKGHHSFYDNAFNTVVAFTNQGFQKAPSAYSFRILTLSMLAFGLLIWLFYSSVLVAYLSVSFTPMPFKNLDDVLEKNTHQICVPDLTIAMSYIVKRDRRVHWDELQPKWVGRVNGTGCPNKEAEFLEAACHNKVVIFISAQHRNIEFGDCSIVPLETKYHVGDVIMSTSITFERFKELNDALIKIWNVGILRYLHKKSFKPLKTQKPELIQAVTFHHLTGLLACYGICAVICVLILVLEILIDRLDMHLSVQSPYIE